jgi:hypothetical protein
MRPSSLAPHCNSAKAMSMSRRLLGEIVYEWGAMIKALVHWRRC